MTAVRLLVRSDLRRRWRSLVAVALLVGVVGGVVLTVAAGARRTDSSFPRLSRALTTADLSLEVDPRHFEDVAALPMVTAVGPASYMFVAPDGFELGEPMTMAAVDDRFGRVVDRPRLLEGRRPGRDRPDEVLLNETAADELGAGPGDRVALASLTPAQLEQLVTGGDPGPPAGPRLEVTVAGVARTELELSGPTAAILFTPAFFTRYQEEVGHFDDILPVRLRRGDRDLPAFEDAVRRLVPEEEGAVIETSAETRRKIGDATGVQAASLAVFAVAAGLAGLVAVGQLLARHIAVAGVDQPRLHALGTTRAQRSLVLLVPAALVAVAGAVVAIGVAVAASPLLPTGFARRVEPDPGLHADWLVLGLGALAIVVLFTARAALSAWSTAGRLSDPPLAAGGPSVAGRLARRGAPAPLVAGVRMALEPGRGSTAIPVRSGLAGAITGVAGLVAALTFGAAQGWVATDPVAYGRNWDALAFAPSEDGETAGEIGETAAALAGHDDIAGVAAVNVVVLRFGGLPVQSYAVEAVKGADFVSVLDGRAPQGADEVLVGGDTLDRLDRRIGDTVVADGLEGGARRELTIVGRGVFPELENAVVPDSDFGGYDHFLLLTPPATAPFVATSSGENYEAALVRWAPDADTSAAARRVEAAGARLQAVDRPPTFTNLARVDDFPALVGAFLVLTALVTAVHVLVTSVRRRTRDLALLRALGFVGSQLRSTVAWQATTFAVVGLVVGIPAGIVVGRTAWALVARRLGIADHIPLPWTAIALTIPATLLLANLTAALPAHRATRIRPAPTLRTE